MQLRHRIEYLATAAMLGLCRRMPRRAVFSLFRGLGTWMYHLLRSRTRLTLKNIEIAFPEKTPGERKTIAKESYRNLAESMAFNTLMMSGRLSNTELLDSVELEGWEHFKAAAQSTDKGLCVFTAHIGNWELMPQYAALKLGEKIHVIARETTNPLLEEKIVKPLRERFGVGVFYKKKALIRMMKAINKGEHTGILVDQKLKSRDSIRVPFFGKTAPTTPAPALLQIRFGVTVLPAFMVKAASGKYRLVMRKAIEWKDNGKSTEEQIEELTCIHQQAVEDIIRAYPNQWFWMHNRWNLKKGEY